MEPIITLISTAIAAGAAAGLKPTVEQAVKDAYEGLKQLIKDRYHANTNVIDAIDSVEKKPDAEKRRESLEDALQDAQVNQDNELFEAANQLHELVQKHAPDVHGGIGVDIGSLKAKVVNFEQVRSEQSGIGVRINDVEAETVTFGRTGRNSHDPK